LKNAYPPEASVKLGWLHKAQPRKILKSQLLGNILKIWSVTFLTKSEEAYVQNFSPIAFKLREEFEVTVGRPFFPPHPLTRKILIFLNNSLVEITL